MLLVLCSTNVNCYAIQGSDGRPGDRGEDGPPGASGNKGERGPPGRPGEQVAICSQVIKCFMALAVGCVELKPLA